MKGRIQKLTRLLVCTVMASGLCLSGWGKGYSSGSHSYSSHSSSHNSSSGSGSHSYGGGSSHSSTPSGSSGSSHSSSYNSGGGGYKSGGKSYSSSSTWDDTSRKSYSSGKSYTADSGKLFSSSFGNSSMPARRNDSDSTSSHFSFDTAAARARKEEASKQEFTRFKDSQTPPVIARSDTPSAATPPYRVSPPPLGSSSRGYYRQIVYIPDYTTISTRRVRFHNFFNPYMTRPVVYYHDPYGSLFWWWLLDRSLDERAWWAYHHRYDMDQDRYQALLAQDAQLQARVDALEAQQTPRDPNYVPAGVDRDLMYSDQYVARAYSNRPTALGVASFRLLGVTAAVGVTGLFIWLIWFKRWQSAT